ncbi:hypothetical protein V8F06_006877 [Rhypophila decipiens]
MAANVNPAEIWDFINGRRQQSSPSHESWPSTTYSHYNTIPRQASPLAYAEAETDTSALANTFDLLSVTDTGSNYTTTASHKTAHSSRAPSSRHSVMSSVHSSIFSRPHRRGGRSHAPSTAPSSRPTRNGNYQNFAHQFAHVNDAAPEAHGAFMLWCEFCDLNNCDAMFRGDDEDAWIDHHIAHLGGDHFPRQLVCWFCDDVPFVSDRTEDRYANFVLRMQHIRGHIFDEHYTRNHMRPDFHVISHLRRYNLIDTETFNHAMGYDELPAGLRLPGDDNQYNEPTQSSRDSEPYVVQDERRRDQEERRRQRRRDRERDSNRRRW